MTKFVNIAQFKQDLLEILKKYPAPRSTDDKAIVSESKADDTNQAIKTEEANVHLEKLLASVPESEMDSDFKKKELMKAFIEKISIGTAENQLPITWILRNASKAVLLQFFYIENKVEMGNVWDQYDVEHLRENPLFSDPKTPSAAKEYRDYAVSEAGIAAAQEKRRELAAEEEASAKRQAERSLKPPFNFRRFFEKHGRKLMWVLGIAVFTFLMLLAFPPLGVTIPFIVAMPASVAAALSVAVTWIMASALHMIAAVAAGIVAGLAFAYPDRILGLLLFVIGMVFQLFSIPAMVFLAAAHLLEQACEKTWRFAKEGVKVSEVYEPLGQDSVDDPEQSQPAESKLWWIPRIFAGIAAGLLVILYGLSLAIGRISEWVMVKADQLLSTQYVHETSAMNLYRGIQTGLGRIASGIDFIFHRWPAQMVYAMVARLSQGKQGGKVPSDDGQEGPEDSKDTEMVSPQGIKVVPPTPTSASAVAVDPEVALTDKARAEGESVDANRWKRADKAALYAWRGTLGAFFPNPDREKLFSNEVEIQPNESVGDTPRST